MGDILDFNKAPRQDEILKPNLDITDIRERLNADVKGFLAWLYSGRAFLGRGEARIGNIKGEPGASLGIALTGPEAGLWIDHATNERGDLITLYRLYRGYPQSMLGLCLKEIAKEYLGQDIEIERPSWIRSPEQQIADHRAEYGVKPRADMLELGAPAKTYKYFDTHGNIIASVVRYEPDGTRASKTFRPWCFKIVDGKRDWRPGAPDLRPLYRLPDIALASTVVLCEGEGCADALATLGIHATSAMQGCKAPIEKTDWTPLAGKTVIVWPDADDVGMDYGKRVAAHLVAIGCQVSFITPPYGKDDGWDAFDCLEEEIDPHAIIETAEPYVKAQKQLPIAVLSIADLRGLPPQQYIIEGWILEDSLGFIYGDPGCGKSFLVLDWALHLAYRMPNWHGIPIRVSGPILYILQEGGRGIVNRIDAFKRKNGLVDDPKDFDIITTPLSFLHEACVTALIETVKGLDKSYRLVIVDTVSRVLPGADENLQKEMTLFVQACERIRLVKNSTVIGLHHTNKNGGMRGSTVFNGAGDFVYKLEKEKGVKPIKITCEKLKDEEDGWFRVANLEKVAVTEQSPFDFNRIKTSLVISELADTSTETVDVSEETKKAILDAVQSAWNRKQPWSDAKQTRDQGRYAAQNIVRQFHLSLQVANQLICTWLDTGILVKELFDAHRKRYGLKVVCGTAEVV